MLREQIAERNRADAKLRESEERFREMAENIGEVIWVVDAIAHRVLYVSPAYESLWGRSSQRLYDDAGTFLEAVYPADLPIAMACMERQMVEPFDAVYRVLGKKGEMRWVRNRSTPIRDETGTIRRITGITEDITDIKKAEAELMRLASIVESSDDAIIGKTLDGHIVSWNAAAARIYGYAAVEVMCRHCSILLPPEDHHLIPPLLARLARGERIDPFEAIRVRKDGSRFHVALTLSSVRDSAGNIIGASEIERDITERKRLEDEVLQISERERRRIGQDRFRSRTL